MMPLGSKQQCEELLGVSKRLKSNKFFNFCYLRHPPLVCIDIYDTV